MLGRRNGDIAHWLRVDGDVTELFDVGAIPAVRCPRGLGPGSSHKLMESSE